MTYENKPGKGIMFHNDKSTEENRQPQYRGSIRLLNGEDVLISAWVKRGKNGSKFLSLSQDKPYNKETKTVDEDLGF